LKHDSYFKNYFIDVLDVLHWRANDYVFTVNYTRFLFIYVVPNAQRVQAFR